MTSAALQLGIYSALIVVAAILGSSIALLRKWTDAQFRLLVGFAAIGYLLWDKARSRRQRDRAVQLQAQKDYLDTYLERTMAIERRMIDARDEAELQRCLEEVMEIKLGALQELTHEDLRGDRMFSIFLAQCADVSGRLRIRLGASFRFW